MLYFRSFVSLEDFIPEGCSLKKKKKQHVTYLQPERSPPREGDGRV